MVKDFIRRQFPDVSQKLTQEAIAWVGGWATTRELWMDWNSGRYFIVLVAKKQGSSEKSCSIEAAGPENPVYFLWQELTY